MHFHPPPSARPCRHFDIPFALSSLRHLVWAIVTGKRSGSHCPSISKYIRLSAAYIQNSSHSSRSHAHPSPAVADATHLIIFQTITCTFIFCRSISPCLRFLAWPPPTLVAAPVSPLLDAILERRRTKNVGYP